MLRTQSTDGIRKFYSLGLVVYYSDDCALMLKIQCCELEYRIQSKPKDGSVCMGGFNLFSLCKYAASMGEIILFSLAKIGIE